MEDLISMLTGTLEVVKYYFSLQDAKCVVLGRLNSDIVENLFCQQRTIVNGANTNPTLRQYGYAINTIIHGQTAMSKKRNTYKAGITE